ncbi:hypothetical protein CBR_g68681 [Chara braunii]|uniref:Reverse transcriptase/retrotransposon-derived protein RNase H-like domain-containing protein n=1 Tax=Chara braunii TaxID=69332 RepID=A0A388K9J4_CHABU|nr:hypothetical protein CBR_g68681 [Chara braunii]|eukprot:GBG66697.1 hypothetical protein CBR_g68681 [Chara braunii]
MSATVPRQQCHDSSATSAVPRQQCHVSSATSAVPRQSQCHVSMTGPAMGLPDELANESIADYKRRFQAQLAFIEAEEQRQLSVEAARLKAEAAATAEKLRLQAEADADAQTRHKEAQDLLQRHEANNIERLKFWHFEPNDDDATPEEQHKEFLSELLTRLLYACNYQRSELERQDQELQQQYEDLKTQHQELMNLRRIVQSHEDATRALNSRVLDVEQAVPGPDAGASSSSPSSRQLEERVDHVVAMLGDISTFAAPTTISSQLDTLKTEVQQLQSTNSDGNPKLPIGQWRHPAATPASRDGDQVAAVQPRSNNKSRNNGKAKPASQAGNGQPTPWVKFSLTEAEYKYRGRYGCSYWCNNTKHKTSLCQDQAKEDVRHHSAALLATSCTSGEDVNVVSSRYTYEDYAVHLVPPLDQPFHVQQSTACTVSSPSATDSAASPPSIARDSTSWSRLEELDPLKFTDFQWMSVPSTERLAKPHCNALMAQLRDYLHIAVPTPLMDAGVEVVDLHAYIAKIDRKFKTQRSGTVTIPYSKEQEERVAALLREKKEKMEKRELIRQAKMLALLEEQEAKKRQMEEEMERWKKEQEEKMTAIQVEEEEEIEEVEEEEERPLERRRGGGSTSKDAEIAERAVRRLEAAERADKDLRAAEVRMGKIRAETELATKLDTLIQSVEALLVTQREQMQYERSQDIKIDAIHAGFKDFAYDMMKHLLTEVHIAINRTREFCTGAIEGAKLAAPKEEESAPPCREKVKVRFPEPFNGKKGEDFDNWEANVHSYLYLQGVTPKDHTLVAFQALRDEATSFARSLARAANCDNDIVTYSGLTPLSDFLKALRERFSDVTRGLKASDKLQMIHTRQWKSVHALKSAMDELIAVPGHGVTDVQLLNLFYPALPENIQGHFFEKKNQQGMTYDTLSREAVAFAAQASPVTTFWHKDLSKGKTWKGRTSSGQIKAKDSLILTMEEGGAEEVPYSDIEWGLEEDNSAGQGRTYAAGAAGGRPQGGQRSGPTFKKLKKALIEYPVLKVADPSLPFVVTTNASQYGIGVVLQQDDGNRYRPVEFMSARLPSEKVAASTYKRELYALRQALEHWKHYLLGRHFKVYSDDETLRWLKTRAKMMPKLTKWAAEIGQYDFELKPVKGKYNVVADALSRRSDYFGAIVHYLDIGADLQQKTIRNAGPLPRIDDLLERLGGAEFFSKLDLKSRYHQLEIREEDRYKTAFKTRYGHFECRSLEEHVEHLRTVLERLRQAKYKANRDKCEFARQELEYLGHYVTPQGIRPLADKIEALRVWPEPTNTTNVCSFMGLAGYYQRFITGYSRIAAPMTRLQSPKLRFVFDDDARRSFQALKTAMLMAPVLSIYDLTLLTRVTTDASGYGIGAVLEQHDEGDWYPVEYSSHKVPLINWLDDARKKELLAFVMTLKQWRHFLLRRRRFTWVTDNNPLTYYKTQDTVSSTITETSSRPLKSRSRCTLAKT